MHILPRIQLAENMKVLGVVRHLMFHKRILMVAASIMHRLSVTS